MIFKILEVIPCAAVNRGAETRLVCRNLCALIAVFVVEFDCFARCRIRYVHRGYIHQTAAGIFVRVLDFPVADNDVSVDYVFEFGDKFRPCSDFGAGVDYDLIFRDNLRNGDDFGVHVAEPARQEKMFDFFVERDDVVKFAVDFDQI